MLSKLQEDYHLIFHEEYVKYYFEYDRAIDKVVLYVGKDYEVVSKTIMAKNSKAVVPYYIIYQDDEYSNYGISSREGEIIIPAQYSDLGYVSEAFAEGEKVYYFERENDRGEMLYYYLDIEKRELSPLKEGIYYLGSFGKIAVFENKDEQRGVLLGNKVIVPLRYDRIDISKELYIGMVTKLGRPTYDFYDTAGKLISVDSFNEIDDISVNSAQIIVKDNAKRRGMLNGKGKLIAPFKYSTLMHLGEDIYVYVEEGDESENNLWINGW